MQTLLLQAFLCQDQAAASISLARATIIERRIKHTIVHMRERLDEARFEPSRFFQWLFNRKRRHIINLTIEDEVDFVITFMFQVCSLQSMVKECPLNQYHNDLIEELQPHISQFLSSQSKVISGLVSPSSIAREIFIDHLTDLQTALNSLQSAYKHARLHHIEEVLRTKIPTPSEDHLSHVFFFFQLYTIARLLIQATAIYSPEKKFKVIELKKSFKDFFEFRFDWSRILSALKSMLIPGVGSIFVMVPTLVNAFADGQ
ncbi:unnamed protein product [Didymodactylos carnosus]|uniref:Uncharacterized protein n=1 Tax=Didymodactylos carnosus TaxID=1234261 RepID=A0A815HCA4_9BILA|nr:unnamed protein product [Didymodactylos carnosus]CAF1540514.1 unnamed protein product [Didymodactylos carnosus]CAF4218791.1 unnamed protein product [Didymodactylos carnosus]CAF4328699.1 unnamed protein product [Didymodactylos carnosus]